MLSYALCVYHWRHVYRQVGAFVGEEKPPFSIDFWRISNGEMEIHFQRIVDDEQLPTPQSPQPALIVVI